MQSSYNTIRVKSLNCQGLNNYYTRMATFDMLRVTNLELIFLQETKLKPEYQNQYVNEWHNHNCIFNCTVGEKHGTAILINVDYITILHSTMCDVEGRVIAIDVIIRGNIFHVVNSYGPNLYDLKIPFLNRLYVYLSSNKHTIWCGDHNIATNPVLDRLPSRLSRDHGAKEFLDLMETFDFKDACRTLYPNKKLYTFRRGSSKSRIDKISLSSELNVEEYEHTDTCFSDHFLITVKIKFSPKQNLGPGVWRNNIKYYQDEEFLGRFNYFWEIYKNSYERNNNLQKWWQSLKYFFKLKSIRYAKEQALYKKREAQIKEQGLNNLNLLLNQNPNSQQLLKHYMILKKQVIDEKIKNIKEKLFKEDARYLCMAINRQRLF